MENYWLKRTAQKLAHWGEKSKRIVERTRIITYSQKELTVLMLGCYWARGLGVPEP
jgi:hypothetical protein